MDHAPRFAARLADAGRPLFTWIFLDPPYQTDLGPDALAELGRAPLLAPDGVLVLEHDRRRPARDRHGVLVKADCRRYGDTELSFYRADVHGS